MDTPPTSHDTSHSLNKPTIGVLLVHGLNGSRRDFAELELALQDRGMLTNNMLLPGHGTHIREVLSLGWQDWADAVRAELNALKQRCDVVFIVGHSLGGSLTLHIAAKEKHLVTFHRSYHVIMKDYDREEVLAKTTAFILHHSGRAKPHKRNTDQTA